MICSPNLPHLTLDSLVGQSESFLQSVLSLELLDGLHEFEVVGAVHHSRSELGCPISATVHSFFDHPFGLGLMFCRPFCCSGPGLVPS